MGAELQSTLALQTGVSERVVAFDVGDAAVRGVLHRPAPGARLGPAVLMLPAGVVGRIGPGGLFVALARRLVECGYTVLRVDLPGLGEAPGEIPARTKWAAFRLLEEGFHLETAMGCVEWLRAETGGDVAALGLCGSAVTAGLVGAASPHVSRVILLNGQLTLTDVDADGQRSGGVFGEAYLTSLKSKAIRPKSLWRLITFRSDWRKILRALADAVRSRLRHAEDLHPLMNRRYVEALARCSADSKRVLMVLGEWDDNTEKYETEYVGRALKHRRYACAHELVRIDAADHNFTSPESRDRLMDALLRWLGS